MEGKSLNIELRNETGKGFNRRLRSAGFVPGVLYSHGTSEVVKVPKKEFYKLFKGRISESVIFGLNITNKAQDNTSMAFVKDYQLHPITGDLVHVDLFRVKSDEKIHTQVPIEITGTPVGVKKGAIMEFEHRIIEVECLPGDLPEKIVIDVTPMDLGDTIHGKDIKLAGGVKLISNPDMVIISVHTPKKVEEKTAEEAAEGAEAAAADQKGGSE